MKLTNNKIYLTWQDVEECIARIYNEICWTLVNPRSFEIVTVIRGGLIPATLLAHKLNIERIHVIPKIHPTQEEFIKDLIILPSTKTKLLFIDDIYDTGKTYQQIRNVLFEYDFKPCFLVMKHAPQNIPQPYYPGRTMFSDQWVVFPWEVNDEIERN